MARPRLRLDRRRPRRAGPREGHRLHRVRPDGGQPARRQPAADDGAGAHAAPRPFADCRRRRRDRPDRRSQRQDRRAAAHVCRAGRDQRRRHSRAARALPRFRSDGCSGASGQQRRLADEAERGRLHARRRQALHRQRHAGQGIGQETHRERRGITYTEFSYSLLQAYDFLELYDRFGCTLQMGGSDQWGNITAGMDLIRRLRAGQGARSGACR